MAQFKASVQYGDWKGSVAADEYGGPPDSANKLLEANGLKDGEFAVAWEIWCGGELLKLGKPHVRAFVFDIGSYASLPEALDSIRGPLPVRKIELELSLQEFFQLFKRFSITLTPGHQDLVGREYEEIENS